MTDFTFYYGAASGSSRKALRQLEEPNVMINYATSSNKPWNGIEKLFIDSGGYSFMLGKGEYGTSNEEYLRFINRHKPEYFALRDYPCEPEVLKEHSRTVAQHQEMTAEKHRELLDKWEDAWWTKSQPVSVVQGWENEDYLQHLDQLRENGLLTDYVAIGSVCRRNQDEDLKEIILSVRENLSSSKKLHAFGVKKNVLRFPECLKALDSADSMAYEAGEIYGNRVSGTGSKSFRDSALAYLKFKKTVQNTVEESKAELEPDVEEVVPVE